MESIEFHEQFIKLNNHKIKFPTKILNNHESAMKAYLQNDQKGMQTLKNYFKQKKCSLDVNSDKYIHIDKSRNRLKLWLRVPRLDLRNLGLDHLKKDITYYETNISLKKKTDVEYVK